MAVSAARTSSSEVGRLGVRRVPLDHAAVATDEELREVPLDPVAEQAALLALEPREERVGVGAVDVDLGEHREGDAVVDLAELLDLGLGAGLLAPELVAGEAEDDEALVAQLLVERLQPLVLGREAARAGGVDDEDDLAGVLGEVALLAGEGRGGEVGEGGHAPHRYTARPRRRTAAPIAFAPGITCGRAHPDHLRLGRTGRLGRAGTGSVDGARGAANSTSTCSWSGPASRGSTPRAAWPSTVRAPRGPCSSRARRSAGRGTCSATPASGRTRTCSRSGSRSGRGRGPTPSPAARRSGPTSRRPPASSGSPSAST